MAVVPEHSKAHGGLRRTAGKARPQLQRARGAPCALAEDGRAGDSTRHAEDLAEPPHPQRVTPGDAEAPSVRLSAPRE